MPSVTDRYCSARSSSRPSAATRRRLVTATAALLPLIMSIEPAATAPPREGIEAIKLDGALKWGAYDPIGTFGKDTRISIEHVYVPMMSVELASIGKAGEYAKKRGRSLLLTVEPWAWGAKFPQGQKLARREMISEAGDTAIRNLCGVIGRLDIPVTIRWGQEMDLTNGRYPWSGWEAGEYIRAYRHFVDTCRPLATKAEFMWSPRGEQSLVSYYPGSAYVDSIGLTVLAYQKYERGVHGRDRSFKEILKASMDLVEQYKKPTMIAEFGCDGESEYLDQCYGELVGLKRAFPNLNGVIFFNQMETFPWPGNFGLPDWRQAPPPIN